MPDKEPFLLPDVHYGKIEEQPDPAEDDSALPEPDDMDVDDDVEHEVTDPSLVALLGFDPLEWREDEEDETETVKNQDGSISKRKKV